MAAHGVAITPDGSLVYIANEDSQTVSKINMSFFTIIDIPLASGANPYGVAITPDGASVYVSNSAGNDVNVINVGSNSITATIPIGHGARQIKITPDGSLAYVANLADGTVSVIAIPGNTVVATIPVGTEPIGVGITPDGQFVYVTNEGSDNVSVISTTSNTVIATIPNLNTPFAVAFGVLPTPPSPPPAPLPLAPQHLRAHVKKNDFAVVYELYVELEWKPHHTSGVKVDGYLIYRGDDLIAKVDAHTFKYKDHDRKKDREYKYSVVAFDTEGNRSAPATIEIKVGK